MIMVQLDTDSGPIVADAYGLCMGLVKSEKALL